MTIPQSGEEPAGNHLAALTEAPLLSSSRIGELNRSRIIQALCDRGPLSRADLAKFAGVNRATIGAIVQALLESGLVEELPPRDPTGRSGKPGTPIWFAPRGGLCAAVVIDIESCEAGLVDARGEVLAHAIRPFPDSTNAADIEQEVVAALREVLPRRRSSVLGTGIAVPGVCDKGVVIGSAHLSAFQGVAVGPHIARTIGGRVIVDNDVKAQALGEKWFGLGRNARHFAVLNTSHGLGVGLVLDGAIFRGSRNDAGEFGHAVIQAGGRRCRCGRRGCWETLATREWLRSEAKNRGIASSGSVDVAAMAAQALGNAAYRELLDDYAKNLGIGLANLVNTVGPLLIILHGDARAGGDGLCARIEETVASEAHAHLAGSVIATSELGDRAALLGAAGLVLSDTFRLVT